MQAQKALTISAKMSAPTVRIDKSTISGVGLALVGTALEQDAAYWEWHIKLPPREHVDTILFGVTQKKDRKFYRELEGKIQSEEGISSEVNGTKWMRKVEVQNEDIVGVAVQQSDLPMVQFFLNGEPLHESAVNRFRGTVYPAICLPESAEETLKVDVVVAEEKFKGMSPSARFGPIIVARSIV